MTQGLDHGSLQLPPLKVAQSSFIAWRSSNGNNRQSQGVIMYNEGEENTQERECMIAQVWHIGVWKVVTYPPMTRFASGLILMIFLRDCENPNPNPLLFYGSHDKLL